MLEKGLVEIYTGDGKGKTTAALGLALRAAGRGNKVLIYQFLKPPCLNTGERAALSLLPAIRIESLDMPWDMAKSPKDPKAISETKNSILKAFEWFTKAASNREFDVLILDEIVYCISKGLVSIEDLNKVIAGRDPHVEIILTGRGATAGLMAMADLVTEMKNIKHPFDQGIAARQGIEF